MKTLLQRMAVLYPDSSKSTLKKWIVNGRVYVNGEVARAPHLEVSDTTLVTMTPKKQRHEPVPVLYEDKHVIVIDKPAGLLSVATEHGHENSVHRILKERCMSKRVYPVHRLDRFVSGVLVFALSQEAKEGLKEQFAAHSIERVYLALVEGHIESSGSWHSLLWEDSNYKVHASTTKGKEATTHYKPLKKKKQTTLLEITLETGRKNQIRVHCAESGHPIVGDTKYGDAHQSGSRVQLHAHKLGFIHPITKKHLVLSSKPPHRLQ